MSSPSGAPLEPRAAFYLVCQEVLRDGRLDPADRARLKQFQKVLRIAPELARALYDRARSRRRAHPDHRPPGPFDPRRLLGRACLVAWAAGGPTDESRLLLERMAGALELPAGTVEELLRVTDTRVNAEPEFEAAPIPEDVTGGDARKILEQARKAAEASGLPPAAEPAPVFEPEEENPLLVEKGLRVLGQITVVILVSGALFVGTVSRGWLWGLLSLFGLAHGVRMAASWPTCLGALLRERSGTRWILGGLLLGPAWVAHGFLAIGQVMAVRKDPDSLLGLPLMGLELVLLLFCLATLAMMIGFLPVSTFLGLLRRLGGTENPDDGLGGAG